MVEVVGSDSVRGGAGETAAYAAAGGDSPVASAPQDNDSCKLSAGNGDAGDRLLPPAQPSPAKPHSGHPPAAHTPSVASDYGGRPGGTLASLRHVSRAFKRTREEADLHAMGAFHSSDYDGLESRLERTALAKTSDWDFDLLHIWRWLLPIIIGIVVGMWTSLFFFTLKKLTDWRFDVTSRYIAPGSGFWRPFGVFLGFSILYSTIAGFLGSILTPASAGGGYAEVLSYLAGVRIQGLLTLPTLVSKLIGLVATIASGIVSGRGGPFVQMGAAIGGGIAGFGSQTISRWSRGWLGSNAWLRSNVGALLTHTAAAHRDFVTVGGAAGLSAAFTAPIAGVLFAVEDGAAFYSVRLLWQSLLASSVSSYVTSFLLEMRDVGGSIWTVQFQARKFWAPGLGSDDTSGHVGLVNLFWYYTFELPIFVLLGAFGGLLGAALCRLTHHVRKFRSRHINRTRHPLRRWGEVVALAAVTTTVWFVISYASPCHPLLAETAGGADSSVSNSRGHLELWCPPGTYSMYGNLFFRPVEKALSQMVQLSTSSLSGTMREDIDNARGASYKLSSPVMALFLVMMMLTMPLSSGVGASAGILVPALAAGAAYGRLVAAAVEAALWSAGRSDEVTISIKTYAVIGAAVMLVSLTRSHIMTVVLIMETSGASTLGIPLILSTFFCRLVADRLALGIWAQQIKDAAIPYLSPDGTDIHKVVAHRRLAVSDVMAPAPVVLTPRMAVSDVVHMLRGCRHTAFPVVEESATAAAARKRVQDDGIVVVSGGGDGSPTEQHGRLLGSISRAVLLTALQHRIGLVAPGSCSLRVGHNADPADMARTLAKLCQRPLRAPDTPEEEDKLLSALLPFDLEMDIELTDFMQLSPFVVTADASVSRAYSMLRTMGLSHLYVTTPAPPLVGVVSRKDLVDARVAVALRAQQALPAQVDDRELEESVAAAAQAAAEAAATAAAAVAAAGAVAKDGLTKAWDTTAPWLQWLWPFPSMRLLSSRSRDRLALHRQGDGNDGTSAPIVDTRSPLPNI